MSSYDEEKRKFKRYNTEAKVYFDFAYDLETKVKFEVIKQKQLKNSKKKYMAVSRNISAEGICFISHKDVKKGDNLYLEVYLPNVVEPIHMRGEVKWCESISGSSEHVLDDKENKQMYQIGVVLSMVGGEKVNKTIYYDKEYGVNWSIVLESVFGSYKMIMGEKYKRKDT